jgi:hypothetical protein
MPKDKDEKPKLTLVKEPPKGTKRQIRRTADKIARGNGIELGGDKLRRQAAAAKVERSVRSVRGLSRLNDPAPELSADQKPKRSTKPAKVGKTPKLNKIEHNKKILLKCLEASLGVVSDACQMAGISRTTFYAYYNEDPEFAAAAAECDELALDFAESKLKQKIAFGDTTATIFFLKTKGKDRGYVERQERTGPNGQPLPAAGGTNVVIFLPDNGRGDGPKPDDAIDITPKTLKTA